MKRLIPGEIMTLTVKQEMPFGYFLTNGMEEVMLHKSEAEKTLAIDDEVTVFLYHGHDGRLCATMKMPKITNNRYDWVEVVDVVPKLGVFVDIGISKDMLVSIDDLPPLCSLWPKRGDQLYCSMNLSHLYSMKRWEFLTISTKEASAQKKAVSFHSMNASEAFLMGPVSNIGITPMGRSNPSTTSCLRNP
jgi:predicted RNA-binding protein (virulence factor B family)